MFLDPDGDVRWLDRARRPPLLLEHEPDTRTARARTDRVLAWLPIESQL